MTIIRTVFREVSLYDEKSGKCGCGKRRVRRQRFYQTINPFNKASDGTPKTESQILEELDAERVAWKLKPITCQRCEL